MKNLIVFLLVLSVSNYASAQSNFTQYQLSNTAQAQYLNPAFRSSSKVGISVFPLSNFFNFQALNTGFAIDDALSTRPNSDSLDLTPEKLLNELNDVNYLDLNIRSELFGLMITTKKMTFNFTVGSVFNSGVSYPKDLLRLAFYGNGSEQFLGKRASIDNLGVDALAYLETGFGFNRKIGEKLVVGGKFKYLIGIGSVQTEQLTAGLFTDSVTYELEADFSGTINTSNSESLQTTVSSFNPFSVLGSISQTGNNGYGFDLGATYQLTEKINLSASVIDLGRIRWRENTTNYHIEDAKYKFSGIDLFQYLTDTSAVTDDILDSIRTLATIQESNSAYTTRLYSKFYVGGNFNVLKPLNLGVVWYNSFNPTRYITGLNLSANLMIRHWISASANYSVYNYRDSNIGLGLSLRAGPFQFFAMSDNLFAITKPESTKNLHLSFGFSIQVGKSAKYDKDKDKDEDEKEMTIF